MSLYQRLHATVHAKNAHLKVHHNIRTTSVSLAWVTPTFELYCVAGANVARNVLAQNANAVLSWVKKEEERLFIVGGAVSDYSFTVNLSTDARIASSFMS